jgi:hypothetical protein
MTASHALSQLSYGPKVVMQTSLAFYVSQATALFAGLHLLCSQIVGMQAVTRVVTVPATNAVRQPLIQLHPTNGYTLL